MNEDVAVRCDGLRKQYRSVRGLASGRVVWALTDCSFELPAGSIVALVGANGAGKTTLLGIVGGLLRPTTGRVESAGRVAFVAQEKPLYRDYTVADMLRFGRHSNLVWDQQRAEQWLSRFDVPTVRRCRRLSIGQQAQVALAVALGGRPNVLLLDEPLANLDPLARREVMGEMLAEAAETGMTVILSTHIVTELAGIADHLLLLARGRLLLDGAVDDLLSTHVRQVGLDDRRSPAAVDVVTAEPAGQGWRAVIRLTAAESLVAGAQESLQPVTLEELVLAYLARSAGVGSRDVA
jgi:ABC-2 type transport system ATP-binding protein